MSEKLRIGKISYLNLLPIFSSLSEVTTGERFEIIEGYPSELNRMLREGRLDISPSSCIEYLRDKERYRYIDGHSISSRGAVRSIFLFSRVPVEEICKDEVMATHQSETSIALLRIILKKFYGHDCTLRVTDEPFYDAIDSHSAYLSIGDDALMAMHNARNLETAKPEGCHAMCTINHQAFFVYDIAELWQYHTGLPAVLALWTYRADLPPEKLELVNAFSSELDNALSYAMGHLEEIAPEAGLDIPEAEVAAYWRGLTYDLPEDCIQGLNLFEKYLIETGQL